MKKTNTLYWIFTALFCMLMLGSAIPDVLSQPEAVKGMHGELGYPLYFIPFIGVAKVLGVLTVLLPINSRIKEWAYAGLTFDLVGATFSIIASGSAAKAPFMLMPLTLAVLAYVFYRKKQAASNSVRRKTTMPIHLAEGKAAVA